MMKSMASATNLFHRGATRNSLQYSWVFLAKTSRRAAATDAAAVVGAAAEAAPGCGGDEPLALARRAVAWYAM